MSNPFGEDSITGYNSNPPPNDGSETVANTADWDLQVVAKIGDPLKNYAQANFANVASAITQLVGGAGVTTVATSYAVTSADRGKLINVNGGSGVTVTTPSATSVGSTFCFGVVNTSANPITLDGSGAQTVNGSSTLTIQVGAAALLNTDGSNWFTYAAPNDPSRTSLFLTAQPMEASVADGNVVYYHVGNAEWTKAQAGTTADVGLGIADVTNGYVFGPGLVSMSFDQGALDTAVDLYLSASTAGEITSTKPGTVVNLGRALSATQLLFFPQKESTNVVLVTGSTFTNNSENTYAHSLSWTPDEIVVKATCTDALGDGTFAQDDFRLMSPHVNKTNLTSNNSNYNFESGFSLHWDGTNVYVTVADSGIDLLNGTAPVTIDGAKWRLDFICKKYGEL